MDDKQQLLNRILEGRQLTQKTEWKLLRNRINVRLLLSYTL